MSTLIEKRAALMAQLKEKQAGLKAGEISDDDATAIKQLLDQVDQLDQQIGKAEDQAQMIAKIGALAAASAPTGNDSGGQNDDAPAKSAGDLFVKSYAKDVGTRLKAGYAVEFKANTDTQTVGDSTGAFAPYTVQTDTQAVFPYQRPLMVADLFSQGTMGASTNAVKYPVFGELEGSAGTVAEGGLKPQLHFPDPKWKADDLKEVAGWFAVSDNNIDGLFNREIQTLGQGADSDADRIFKCRKLIATATGFQPDGIVINPTDYEAIRLSKDANGQYFGGGFFTGQYGQGGIMQDPPLWGVKTVVTEAIAPGTALVGAFKAGGKVLRKGGLRIESTNAHADYFINDKVAIRLKERLTLQVKYPKAFVKVTLGKPTTATK